MLHDIDHVFRHTYFSGSHVTGCFERLINNKALVAGEPKNFWRTAHVLDIQQNGHSQSEIRQLFGNALKTQFGLDVDDCGLPGGAFIYLDDVLFTGTRIGDDLSAWIQDDAPAAATTYVLVIASHSLGSWQSKNRLKEAASSAGKEIGVNLWAAIEYENRKQYRDTSEVLWPAVVPDDPRLKTYMAEEQRFPFEPRRPAGKLKNAVFASDAGRQLLERELLLAGMRIRSFCANPTRALRPLGFSPFGLGFGSLVVTYRNCPNNAPLALWWGDPNARPGHPLRRWYPLLPSRSAIAHAIAASIFRELPFGLPDQHDPFIVRESRPATYRIRQGGETGRRNG